VMATCSSCKQIAPVMSRPYPARRASLRFSSSHRRHTELPRCAAAP
jgi:hypothetical protein